jgi:hypothetical protein
MNLDDILKIAQLGTSGVLLFILVNLWAEFRSQNEFIRQMLLDAAKDRAALAASVKAITPPETAQNRA